MRTLYFTVAAVLLAVSSLSHAAKIEAIDDVKVTPCLTTRITFNQEALKPYQGDSLMLKIEDVANDKSYLEPIKFEKGSFIWEKAILIAENLTFTLVKDNTPISYPYSKETVTQLAKVIAPMQVAQADTETNVLIRSVSALAEKKALPIALNKAQLNKELLVLVTSADGKVLWQYYGKADKNLTASIPSDAATPKPHIIPSNTVCNK